MSRPGSTTSVALRPWPAPQKEAIPPHELFERVNQLTLERGHLRSITEKSLHDEIDTGKDVLQGVVLQGIEQDETKDAPTRPEQLQELAKKSHEMRQKAEWAYFNAANALDLVAQLLSRETSKNLDASYSNGFRQLQIPNGSFGLDKGPPAEMLPNDGRKELVARGSRMESLEWSTDSFLNAAQQLQIEVQKETTYWKEIMSISRQGWSLQRFGRGSRNASFAVRYGFSESSDHFKARGLAPLRMDTDGGIILDPALALKPKTLRVRVSSNGKIMGTSCLHVPTTDSAEGVAVERSIRLARDSLFEEELYHEMSLETRQLHGYGVELRNSVISLNVPGSGHGSRDRKILIDCIPRDDDALGSQDQPENGLAQNVAESLRLLLSHEHRMRLFRRSQLPPPLTKQNLTRPSPPFLRTLLAMLSHLDAVDSLQLYLSKVANTLESAGLNVSLQPMRETSWVKLTNSITESSRTDLSAVDQLLEVFTKPFYGLSTLSLPSNETQSENITIATRTCIGSPPYGSEHKVTLPPSLVSVQNLSQDQAQDFKFPSTEEVTSYLDWILSLDLSHTFLTKMYGRRAIIVRKDPHVSILYKDGKEQKHKEVSVQVADGRLKVTLGIEQAFTWDGAEGNRSFKDSLKGSIGS